MVCCHGRRRPPPQRAPHPPPPPPPPPPPSPFFLTKQYQQERGLVTKIHADRPSMQSIASQLGMPETNLANLDRACPKSTYVRSVLPCKIHDLSKSLPLTWMEGDAAWPHPLMAPVVGNWPPLSNR